MHILYSYEAIKAHQAEARQAAAAYRFAKRIRADQKARHPRPANPRYRPRFAR